MRSAMPGGSKALYARYLMADLQMQTPVDRRNWVGAAASLPASPTDDEYNEAAALYIDRCYEVGLDVIGLTDHNLGGPDADRFHRALFDAIDAMAAEQKWRPTIYPGFEVQANVGKGMHLLCLFDPGTDFADVDDVLSELGLPKKARFDAGKPNPLPEDRDLEWILNCVQRKHGGIVIAAHPDGPRGALSDKDLDEWLQASVITNPNLLCMELRNGREAYAASQSKLGLVVRNDAGIWHRQHPIAVVSSSDCKRLTADDGGGDESWIGRRFTWVKMSERSVEGLRQVFLDHDSRIAFGGSNPDSIAEHPRIERVRVEGVDFLVDLDMWMSPNLTTLIGGGGTGKSSILEYCRAALQQTASESSSDASANHEEILSTIGGGRIELTLSHGPSVISASVSASGAEAVEIGSEEAPISNLDIRFPATVLGQREVYEIAGSQRDIRLFVDRINADDLRMLEHTEHELRSRVIELGELLDSAAEQESRRNEIRGERSRLLADVRLAASTSDESLSPEDALREIALVRRIDDSIESRAESIASLADKVAAPLGQAAAPEASSHEEEIQSYAEDAEEYLLRSAEDMREISSKLLNFRNVDRDLPREFEIPESWLSAQEGGEVDANIDVITDLLERLKEFDRQIEELGEEGAKLRLEASARSECLQGLHAVWDEQISTRQAISVRLRDLVPATDSGQPFVEISVIPFGHTPDLEDAVAAHIDDNRRFNTADISDLVKAVYSASPGAKNPVVLLCDWLRSLPDDVPDELETLSEARISALAESFSAAAIRRLETSRPSDTISVMLRRRNGAVAGTLARGLSVGQKCTAILALALAEGTFPIFIDQPEDEIDNEFIYQNLVPLLRGAKQKRQVILATHDPNLPVNGDAELIVALEAKSEGGSDARGMIKTLPEGRCVGSLDRRAVKLAVEEIMEGSEEAFRRRFVRYGF